MKLKTKRNLFATVILSSSALILSACSSDDVATTEHYNGPGSKWDIVLNPDNTFHIDHRPSVSDPIDYTVDGNYTRNASGFISMTVTGGTGVNAPSVGSEAWALEVPGYAFMLKPVDSEQLIAMVTAGSCPTEDFDANWVIVKKDTSGGSANATDPNRDFVGTFSFDAETSAPSLPITKALSTGFPTVIGGGLTGSASCADGIMTLSGAVMYLTANGGAIVHTDGGTPGNKTDDSFIFGLGQSALTNISETDGNYAGMLFDDNQSGGNKLLPVSLSCISGTCIGTIVTDVTTGAASSDTVTVVLSNSINEIGGTPVDGFITGTIDDGLGGVGNMACMADPDAAGSGKKIVNCVGQSPGDNDEMFNVLFVSI